MESSNANHDAPQEGVPYPLDAVDGGTQPLSSLEESDQLAESVERVADDSVNDVNDTVEFKDVIEPAAAAGQGQPDDDDESVADYISELLKRISGDPSDATPSSYQVPTETQNVQESSPSQSATTNDTDTEAEAEPVERKRREPAVIPEALLDMSAMRALANQSARGAIDTHDQRLHTRFAYTGLLLAGTVIMLTLIIGQITAVPLSSRLSCSLVGLVISLYLCFRYHHITGKLSAPGADAAPSDENATSAVERLAADG